VLVLILYLMGLGISIVSGLPLGDFSAMLATVVTLVVLVVSVIAFPGLTRPLAFLFIFMLGVASAHLAF